MAFCESCGAGLAAAVKFCGSCGAPVRAAAPKCATCGTALTPDDRFCQSCGTPVGTGTRAAVAAARPPPPAGPPLVPPPATSDAAPASPPASVLAVRYSGFWRRAFATLIDGALLSIVTLAVLDNNTQLGSISASAYYVALWSTGGTLGQRLLGMRVVTARGRPPSIVRSVIRLLGLAVSFVAFAVGVLWVAFDARKQGWHDKMAGTFVVRAGTASVTTGNAARGSGVFGPVVAIVVAVVLFGVAAVAGVGAFQAGLLPDDVQAAVLGAVGRTPATVSVTNLRDDTVTFTVRSVKRGYQLRAHTLMGFGASVSFTVDEDGVYPLEVTGVDARNVQVVLGTCNLTLHLNDRYDFAVLPNGVAVDHASDHAKIAADYVVATSSLCK